MFAAASPRRSCKRVPSCVRCRWRVPVSKKFTPGISRGCAMQREGSPWTGLGAVFQRELADNLLSVRMRLMEVLVSLTGTAAVYAAIGEIKTTVGEDPFVFLRIFTVAREPLPSFITFLGFLIPIVAISLGFDSINGEFNTRTI